MDIAEDKVIKDHEEQDASQSVEDWLPSMRQCDQDAVFMMDEAGRISFWSHAAEQLLGHSSDEAIGRELRSLINPACCHDAIQDARTPSSDDRPGDTASGIQEYKTAHKDGRIFWISLSVTAVDMKGGRHAIGVMRDITARRMIEDQLRGYSRRLEQERTNLQHIFEASPVGLMLIDETCSVRQINQVAAHIVGRTREDFLGRQPGEGLCCIHAVKKEKGCGANKVCRDCPIWHSLVQALQEQRSILDREVGRVFLVNGEATRLFFKISTVPVNLEEGVHALFAIEDITRNKHAELALRASEKKFRDMFELSPIGIALNDYHTGDWLDFNQAILRSTDYSEDEFRALSYYDVTPREYYEQEKKQLASMEKTGYYGPYEKEYIRKDGNRYPVRLVGMKYRDDAGRDVIWSFIQDISEEKAAAHELLRLSMTDHLTQLFNRGKLLGELQREIDRSLRYGDAMALIMFDVDHFKRINDTFGHSVGDTVLQAIADVGRAIIRQTDLLARWGGEEFMLLTVKTNVEQAAALAERLRSGLSGTVFPHGQQVTCSFGVTGFLSGDTVDTMTQRVDEALYAAKETGRNRVVVAGNRESE